MTTDGKQRSRANLLKGVSDDPDVRARQVSHLKRGNVRSGAYGGQKLAELQAKHEQELLNDYPALDGRRRAILADRLARVEAASEWVRENGLTPGARHQRAGEVFGIADRLESWGRRCEDMLAAAEQEQREHSAKAGGSQLERIVAEINAGRPAGEDKGS